MERESVANRRLLDGEPDAWPCGVETADTSRTEHSTPREGGEVDA